jgi:hypothetical protein
MSTDINLIQLVSTARARMLKNDQCFEIASKDRIMSDDDFGFSLVSEQELKVHEELLKQKLDEQSSSNVKTTTELIDKINALRAMIMPLLLNLAKDPGKEYIRWPDRAEKIQVFIQRVNEFVDS